MQPSKLSTFFSCKLLSASNLTQTFYTPAAAYRLCSCSVACGKDHKQALCSAPSTALKATNRGIGRENAAPTGLGSAKPSQQASLEIDDEGTTLSAEQRAALLSDERVGAAARDPTLQAVIRRIDSARDPATALSQEMCDPDFEVFADALLRAIGASGNSECQRAEKLEASKAELQRLLAISNESER